MRGCGHQVATWSTPLRVESMRGVRSLDFHEAREALWMWLRDAPCGPQLGPVPNSWPATPLAVFSAYVDPALSPTRATRERMVRPDPRGAGPLVHFLWVPPEVRDFDPQDLGDLDRCLPPLVPGKARTVAERREGRTMGLGPKATRGATPKPLARMAPQYRAHRC